MPQIWRNDKGPVEERIFRLAARNLVQIPILFRITVIPFESRARRKLFRKPCHLCILPKYTRRCNSMCKTGCTHNVMALSDKAH